jgi:CubicO group peptidase (beta-lactamase class C family)
MYEARMKELGVPAISYAVIEDGKIVLAAAYGNADERGQGRTHADGEYAEPVGRFYPASP